MLVGPQRINRIGSLVTVAERPCNKKPTQRPMKTLRFLHKPSKTLRNVSSNQTKLQGHAVSMSGCRWLRGLRVWFGCMHTYIRTYIHTHIHSCIHTYTYMHRYLHTYIHTYIHACIHSYIHTCMHAYIHASMHACMHACMHAYVHAYIHTYIRTYVRTYVRAYIHIVNTSLYRELSCIVYRS